MPAYQIYPSKAHGPRGVPPSTCGPLLPIQHVGCEVGPQNCDVDIVAWNRAPSVMLIDYGSLPPDQRNILRFIFLDPRTRAVVAGLLIAPFGGNFATAAGVMTCFALLSILAARRQRDYKRSVAAVGTAANRRIWTVLAFAARGKDHTRTAYANVIHPGAAQVADRMASIARAVHRPQPPATLPMADSAAGQLTARYSPTSLPSGRG